MQLAELHEAIARQRESWSLEQPFYTSLSLFDFERQSWLADQSYVLGHRSELP